MGIPKANKKLKTRSLKTASKGIRANPGTAKVEPFFKIKRPGFIGSAVKKKVQGTDLAHRTSYQRLGHFATAFARKTLSKGDLQKIVVGIDPKLEPVVKAFTKGNVTRESYSEFLHKCNSAIQNLDPGNSRTNRSIQGLFDPGSAVSKSSARERSPSPISKRQLTSQLMASQSVSFKFDGQHVIGSRVSKQMKASDLKSSLVETTGHEIDEEQNGGILTYSLGRPRGRARTMSPKK